jgi:N-acetylmuramoyl-L-alanine amidase
MHTVKQGEHIIRIAHEHGLTKYEIIWDHPQNAALKSLRKTPHILFPGDELFIPEIQKKEEQRPTGKLHTFQVEGQPLKLKLRVTDEGEDPIANTACRLNIQGETKDHTTDGDARLERPIPPEAEDAMLDITGVQIPIKIGHLDPIDTLSGQQARLNNLGYDAGNSADANDEQFRSAVEEFQCDRGIKPITGVCDTATQAKLKTEHGC